MVGGLAALAGLACWQWAARSGLERVVFSGVMRGFANPPFFLSGTGTAAAPWALRTLAVKPRMDSRKAPVVVSIGDDPGRVFQSSPPSPVDLAVVLQNLQRLGGKQAALAAVLAWAEPDPVSLKGLELVLNNFQMVVQAAPLSRGTVRQPLPPALRRASLALDSIQGDTSRLPLVNRLAVADVIFGGDRALAGFSSLDDAEAGAQRVPLLARWEEEERVVLAFPLLAVLARYDLPVAGIRVKLGEFLQLGPAGPVVPIDRDGRMSLPPKPLASRADVSAEALIIGTPDIFPAAPGLIVLRDDQATAPRATREFSANLASAIASIGSDAGLGPACTYRRLSAAWELSLLLAVVLLLTLLAGRGRFERVLGCGMLAAACAAAQWLLVGLAQLWLPGIPLLGAILAGVAAMILLGEARPAPQPLVVQPVPVAPPALAPRGAAATDRKFRTVTVWKEPATIQPPREPAPSRSEEAAPVAAVAATPPRKTPARKASSKKTPAAASAADQHATKKSAAKPPAVRRSNKPPGAGKARSAAPPPES